MVRSKRVSSHRYLFVTAGCLQFIVLTLVAMLFFPGGYNLNHDKQHYDFFHNFFSTLGRTAAHDGDSNYVSAAIFIFTTCIAGVCLITFFVMTTRLFRPLRQAQDIAKLTAWLASIASAIFGTIGGLSLIGVAFTPMNIVYRWHMRFMFAAFTSLLLVGVFYIIAVLLAPHYPKRYALSFGIFVVLLSAYMLLLWYGPRLQTHRGVLIQATSQKLIVYSAMLTILYQGVGAHRVASQTTVS